MTPAAPLARLPVLEWCHRAASGGVGELGWVDTTLEVNREIYRVTESDSGAVQFQHLPYAGFQPPSMLDAERVAAARGTVTLQECLLLLFARLEWSIAARGRLWTELSFHPAQLAALVEAYGVEPSVHRGDPEVLARLVALLPSWFPSRGTVAAARRLLAAAEPDEPPDTRCRAEDGPTPAVLHHELFACHSLAYWEERWTDGTAVELRIEQGVVLFQPDLPTVVLRREDLAVAWRPGQPLLSALLRLMPPWTVVRPYLAVESV